METLEAGTAGYVEGLDFGRRQGAVVDVCFVDLAKELVLYVMGIGTDCASDRIDGGDGLWRAAGPNCNDQEQHRFVCEKPDPGP